MILATWGRPQQAKKKHQRNSTEIYNDLINKSGGHSLGKHTPLTYYCLKAVVSRFEKRVDLA